MFPKRRIEEIGSRDLEARLGQDRSVLREFEAMQAIQQAFFCSETTHDFQEGMNAFVDAMAKLYLEHQEQSRATPEEWVIHVLPNHLLDRLPAEFYGIHIGRSGVDQAKISYQSEEGAIYEDVIDLGELKRIFGVVRQRLQDRIKEKGLESIHVVDRRYSTNGPMRLHDQKIYRRKRDFIPQHAEALRELYELPERSRYLRYPAMFKDVDSLGEETGGLIRTELDIMTVAEGLEKRALSLPRVLLVVADTIRGLLFLERHHLRLSDLDFSNMGIDLETGRGTLFDYDGLVIDGTFGPYPVKPAYTPPELVLEVDGLGMPIGVSAAIMNEKHAVYEIGVSLSRLWEPYFVKSKGSLVQRPAYFMKREDQAALYAFVRRMKNKDPLKRPTLLEVLEELDAACRPYLAHLQEENVFENQTQTTPDRAVRGIDETLPQHPVVYSGYSPSIDASADDSLVEGTQD
ncbi:hypothetical protein KBB27_00785 [Patescibacteria group bacterium]|nr:hypothetical protein [Patescibacteria group bacterium]